MIDSSIWYIPDQRIGIALFDRTTTSNGATYQRALASSASADHCLPVRSGLEKDEDVAETLKTPIYVTASQKIAREIREGVFKQGERLPSERELGDQLGISRMTARNIYLHLEQERLLTRTNRSGWYVTRPPIHYALNHSASFISNVEDIGASVSIDLLDKSEDAASAEIATALGLPEHAPINVLRRLFRADGRPSMIETLHFSASLFPGILDEEPNQSILSLWKMKYSIVVQYADVAIRAMPLGAENSRVLDVFPGTQGICMTQVFHDSDTRPIAVSRQIWRNDMAEFQFVIDYRRG